MLEKRLTQLGKGRRPGRPGAQCHRLRRRRGALARRSDCSMPGGCRADATAPDPHGGDLRPARPVAMVHPGLSAKPKTFQVTIHHMNLTRNTVTVAGRPWAKYKYSGDY